MGIPVVVMEPQTALVAKVFLYMCLQHDIVRGAIVAVKPDKWPVVLHHEQSKDGREIVGSIFNSKNKNSGLGWINSNGRYVFAKSLLRIFRIFMDEVRKGMADAAVPFVFLAFTPFPFRIHYVL